MSRRRTTISLSDRDKRRLDTLSQEIVKNKPPSPIEIFQELEVWRGLHEEKEPTIYIIDGKKVKNRAAIESEIANRWLLSHLELSEQISNLELELSRLRSKAKNEAMLNMGTKSIFISHASEDKDDVARPLAEMLCDLSVPVWYDEYSLKLGDSLRGSIEEGLAECDFGVVIISPSFFQKKWTEFELDGLTSKEMLGNKVIIPVWHDITKEEIIAKAPSLANKVAARTADGLDRVVSLIVEAIA